MHRWSLGVNNKKPHLDSRIWLTACVGLVIGILSLLCAQLVDAGLNEKLPEWQPFLWSYVLAGVTFAVGFSLAVRILARVPAQRRGAHSLAVHSSTVSFLLFLVTTLVASPDSTGRWLAYTYAFSLLFGWLVWQLWLAAAVCPTDRATHSLNGEQEAGTPFGAVALVLLAASLICTVTDQPGPAIQLANWSYGFLLLAVLVATVHLLLKRDLFSRRLGRLSGIVVPIAVLAFFPIASFVEAGSQSVAEKQVITDVYPRFLAQQLKDGDLIITDSPTLRLNNIPRLGASLTIDPDARGQAIWEDLTRALENKQRVLWITVPGQSHDTKGMLATFLRANGCLDAISTTSLPVQVFELNKPITTPRVLPPFLANRTADAFDAVQVSFGAIEMTGMRYATRVCSHDSVAVAVRWMLQSKTPNPLQVSFFLLDAKGRRVQMQDFYIDDLNQRHTDQWQPGSMAAYYVINVPLGTPPGSYTLGAAVYAVGQPGWMQVGMAEGVARHSTFVELGHVEVYRGLDPSADPWRSRSDEALLPADVAMQSGLMLDGYAVGIATIIPGEPLNLALRWRALTDGLPSYSAKVSLRQGEKVIAEQSSTPVDGTYPTDQWKAGEYVTERRELRVPPSAAGGLARLHVSVAGGNTVWLADINLQPITRTYQLPTSAYAARAAFPGVGDLIGYDFSPRSSAKQPFDLTIYWQARGPVDKDYVVFAQLLTPDGQLIAQSDSAPAQGSRPTRSWLPGEILADKHALVFRNQDYQGQAQLIVGLYDPETGERLPVEGTPENYYLAPTRIQIIGP